MKRPEEIHDISFESLRPLALLAMRESGAEGFALYATDPGSGASVEKCSSGLAVPTTGWSGAQVLSFPLRANGQITGRLVFSFPALPIPPSAQLTLAKILTGIEAVWRLLERQEQYTTLALRIGRLEAELADSKIANRVQGLLAQLSTEPETLTAVARHIDGVLRSSQSFSVLEQRARDLEEELAEREVAAQAKVVLQSVHGMSEEQAYHHLRVTSRRSRKPLREVAQELLEAVR